MKKIIDKYYTYTNIYIHPASCIQVTLHGFCGSCKGIWLCSSESYLVSIEKTWHWTNGLCDWLGACMLTLSDVSVNWGYSQEFEMKAGVHQGLVVHCSSLLCLRPFHASSMLVSPGKISMPMILCTLFGIGGRMWTSVLVRCDSLLLLPGHAFCGRDLETIV